MTKTPASSRRFLFMTDVGKLENAFRTLRDNLLV
jgi:hypothetical protein